MIAKRLISFDKRIEKLIDCMLNDTLSTQDNVVMLKTKIFEYTNDSKFVKSKNMGEILKHAFEFIKLNYKTENTDVIF